MLIILTSFAPLRETLSGAEQLKKLPITFVKNPKSVVEYICLIYQLFILDYKTMNLMESTYKHKIT